MNNQIELALASMNTDLRYEILDWKIHKSGDSTLLIASFAEKGSQECKFMKTKFIDE